MLRPIGVVRNPVKEPQPPGFDWGAVKSEILVRPELADSLLGLDTYSHVKVLFWPHLVPAEVIGWVCECGRPLDRTMRCAHDGKEFPELKPKRRPPRSRRRK